MKTSEQLQELQKLHPKLKSKVFTKGIHTICIWIDILELNRPFDVFESSLKPIGLHIRSVSIDNPYVILHLENLK